ARRRIRGLLRDWRCAAAVVLLRQNRRRKTDRGAGSQNGCGIRGEDRGIEDARLRLRTVTAVSGREAGVSFGRPAGGNCSPLPWRHRRGSGTDLPSRAAYYRRESDAWIRAHKMNSPETYRCWAEIDRGALLHNLGIVRKRIGTADVLAVVKANAYGHGLVGVAETVASEVQL